MKFILTFLLPFTFSCTRLKERKEQTQAWVGHPVEDVKTHPYFTQFRSKARPAKGGREILTFEDGNPITTGAGCQSISGCGVNSSHWCEHHLTIHQGVIVHYEQYGPCPYKGAASPGAQ